MWERIGSVIGQIADVVWGFLVTTAVSWALLMAASWGSAIAFGSSPFSVNGTEILLGAALVMALRVMSRIATPTSSD
jgi:hypothetical protein